MEAVQVFQFGSLEELVLLMKKNWEKKKGRKKTRKKERENGSRADEQRKLANMFVVRILFLLLSYQLSSYQLLSYWFCYPSSSDRIALSFLRTVKIKKKRVRKRTNEQSSSVQFSPVQFNSRWYLCAWKSPPRLIEVSPALPLKWFQRPSDWQGPLSFFQGRLPSAASWANRAEKDGVGRGRAS